MGLSIVKIDFMLNDMSAIFTVAASEVVLKNTNNSLKPLGLSN